MGLTLNLIQFKRDNRKTSKQPVYLRMYKDGKIKYFNTGIDVEPKFWNGNKQKVRATHNRHIAYNDELTRIKISAEDKVFELRKKDRLSLKNLKEHLESGSHQSVVEYAKQYRENMDEQERYWEHRKFKVLIGDLEHFLNGEAPAINTVKLDFVEGFRDYLLSNRKRGKPNNPNTVRRKMRRFKAMFTQARKEGVINQNPFQDFKHVKKQEANRVTLSLKQIKDIEDLELKPNTKLWHSRNIFLYSYYNAGIRFGDLCTLRWKNIVDGRLVYKMMKTGGIKRIKQAEPMKNILSHYESENQKPNDLIFPILDKYYKNPMTLRKKISSKNVLVNRALGKLADKAGVEANISMHVSRNAFASHALKKNLDLYQISKALGHSKLKTTEEYLKSFDEEHLDEGMEKFLNG